VDGAFGLWAATSTTLQALVKGIELADSASVDCHKWLNVPQDSGLVFVRDAAAHHAAMTLNAPYYVPAEGVVRENHNWVPEASRRARGFPVYVALRVLGRSGLAELIDRCCRLAKRMAERLAESPGVQILNEVVLNQVLVRFSPKNGGDPDAFTSEVIIRVQKEGTCWLGGTTWHGMHAMRVSISNWSTTENDIDVSADAILSCAQAVACEWKRLEKTGKSSPGTAPGTNRKGVAHKDYDQESYHSTRRRSPANERNGHTSTAFARWTGHGQDLD
jgi:glutamate/tyrosine decarboxylase-like PLP-dependent enzyme